MIRLAAAIVLGLVAAFTYEAVRGRDIPAPNDLRVAARQFVEHLVAGEYAVAVKTFDARMTRAMPPEKIRKAWQSLPLKVGPLREIVGVRMEKAGPLDIAVVTCRFEKSLLDVKIVYNAKRKVSGLRFAPSAPAASPLPPDEDSKSLTEQEVTVGSGAWVLPGTVTVPVGDGPFPAVVLVHGSGPHDRDETLGPNKPFRDLARGLATRGVAVLRYEKRTKHHQLKMATVANSITVKEETIDDAVAAVATLRATEKIDTDRIFVLGHSLGGMVMPRIAEHANAVAGYLIFAGTSRPFEDVLLEQMRYVLAIDGQTSESEAKTLKQLEVKVARVKSSELTKETPSSELPLGVPASYWLDLRGYDPSAAAAELEKPLLILQGGRDYQVTMDDFGRWKQALVGKKNVDFLLYPKGNHLFIEGEDKCTPAEYAKAGHVAETVVDDIAIWIKEQQ
jgi:uncharacterized protein